MSMLGGREAQPEKEEETLSARSSQHGHIDELWV